MGRRPSAVKKREVRFLVTETDHKRLLHHAERIGSDMANIARDGVVTHLDDLDQREIVAKDARLARENRGGRRDRAHYSAPKGLSLSKPPTLKPVRLFPERIEGSFRRFAEYLEAAATPAEREKRAQEIVDDIKGRVDQAEEIDPACQRFAEFMKERAASRRPGALEISSGVHVAGDVEKEGDQ